MLSFLAKGHWRDTEAVSSCCSVGQGVNVRTSGGALPQRHIQNVQSLGDLAVMA